MVKNSGGNKAKGFARKNFSKGSNSLRTSDDDAEKYAQVTKMLGNSMCRVIDLDGKEMLCHIRGKFSGRGKRDNLIGPSSWLLVGMREWEIEDKTKGKLLNCDVLTVYNDSDKARLKNTIVHINWNTFLTNDTKMYPLGDEGMEDTLEFIDEKKQEYHELISSQFVPAKMGEDLFEMEEEDDINIDDI